VVEGKADTDGKPGACGTVRTGTGSVNQLCESSAYSRVFPANNA